ncbi:MAG: crossover junction endodeoxyribonuclease RuvC [Patescibacteria group bacterium]
MLKKPLTILGINPGTRYLGVAVFQGPDLRDWRIKALQGKFSKEKLDKFLKIIVDLIEQYHADVLAIKKLHPSRSSSNLNSLASKIISLSKRKGLKVYQYSIKDVKNFFSPNDKTNKKKLAESMAMKYPDLLAELNREKTIRNPYYLRMFEAVALGSICLYQIDKQKYVTK